MMKMSNQGRPQGRPGGMFVPGAATGQAGRDVRSRGGHQTIAMRASGDVGLAVSEGVGGITYKGILIQ